MKTDIHAYATKLFMPPAVNEQPAEAEKDMLAWTVLELVDAVKDRVEADEIGLQDVKELVSDLKKAGGEIGKRIAEKLDSYIEDEVYEKELCPKCFGLMVSGGIVSERVGECHGTPAWQNVATKKVCQDCDYEEAI